MLNAEEARAILENAELVHSKEEIDAAVNRLAGEIGGKLREEHPLVLSIMGGAVVFTGQLLPLLDFPLDFDYIHVSRYGKNTSGGSLDWRVLPRENVNGRVVLVLDDILDEGQTMAAVRERVLAEGAKAFYSAVFCDKNIGRAKPIRADFVGLPLPDRYVFGFGMDVHGAWRNLPAIYAKKDD
ncbi:MAG: hypoxanthine-guanine phosphoribosyltransferase [Burkholderiales bacterium]|nr:hypoxanthine-guanine phosphoribosyltransferase [Burkholderiales bacterium]